MDEHLLKVMVERVKAKPEMMKRWKDLVEHPFGTIKTLCGLHATFNLAALHRTERPQVFVIRASGIELPACSFVRLVYGKILKDVKRMTINE